MALAIFAMFGFGLWMRTLGYYDSWYQRAPHLHQVIGLGLAVLLVVRWLWRLANPRPSDNHLTQIERRLSHAIHLGFYPVLAMLMVSGYLISTVDGRPIEIFNGFSVPSLYQNKGFEEIAGKIHQWLAWTVIFLAGLHISGALKHHFVDHDNTMSRMWRGE